MWMCYLQIVIYLFLFIYFSLDLVYLCSEKTDVRQPWTLKSWGGKLTLSTQLIKPEFMLRTLVDTTPTFIRNWTFSSGGSTRSSTHPDPKALFPLYRLTLALTRKILTVGKQDARIVELCIPNNRTVLAEKWRHKIDSKILFQLMAQQIGNFEAGIETNAKIWKTQLLKEI